LAPAARPGWEEPTSRYQAAGSMGTLARDEPVIPGVTFLSPPAPTGRGRWIARPGFPLRTPCVRGSCQAGFCPCTLQRVSVPPEPTFGLPRYLFGGVPPQPNCPPAVVPGHRPRLAGQPQVAGVTLAPPRAPGEARIDGSRLRYAPRAIPQRQAAVKLHRVFSPRWGFVDCSSTLCGFTGLRAGTVGPSLIHSCTSELTRQGIWLP
jgi:hypothetical protein